MQIDSGCHTVRRQIDDRCLFTIKQIDDRYGYAIVKIFAFRETMSYNKPQENNGRKQGALWNS